MVESGWPPERLEDMDLLSFNALAETVLRLRAAAKIEDAWTRFVTSQGEQKHVTDWVKRWEVEADLEPAKKLTGDDLRKKFNQ